MSDENKKVLRGFTIDKDVPVPRDAGRGGRAKYPFAELEVEESFVVPNTKKAAIRASVTAANKRYPEKRFITYTQSDGSVRVWRVS